MPVSVNQPRRQRDSLEKALTELAAAALPMHFSDEMAVKRYRAAMRSPKRTRATGFSGQLAVWRPDDESQVILRATKERMVFTLDLHHPIGAAIMTVSYDIDMGVLGAVSVETMEGNRRAFKEIVREWIDEIEDDDPEIEDDDPEVSVASLLDFLGAGKGDPDDAPPPPSAADAKRVLAIVKGIARDLARGQPTLPPDADRDWLIANCQVLWPVLDGYVAACQAKRRNDETIAAWLHVLVPVLRQLRLSHEAGYAWAPGMIADYQSRVRQLGQDRTLQEGDWFPLTTALTEAGIRLSEEDRHAMAEIGMGAHLTTPEEAAATLSQMLDQVARDVETPFAFAEAFGEILSVVPSELGSFLAFEIARSPHEILREALPLLLLDSNVAIRRGVASAMRQAAQSGDLSPLSLRRAIAVRSWLPEVERPVVDEAIRLVRLKGVEPAPWPAAMPARFIASIVDGGGSCSVVAFSQGKGKAGGFVGGTLLKQGVGVADVWCEGDRSRRDMEGVEALLVREMHSVPVTRAFADAAIQHALATGAANGAPPKAALLEAAERLGGSDWKDRGLDVGAEARALFAALPDDIRQPARVEKLLQRGAELIHEPWAESWFEDTPEVRQVLASLRGAKAADRARRLLTETMPATRAVWTERFVLMAMRAAATTDRKAAAQLPALTVLAEATAGPRPLSEIPMMAEIARATVRAVG